MERRLTVRIHGPGVPRGKVALKDLQRIVRPLEQAVRATLPFTEPSTTEGGKGKRPDARFLLLDIREGSAVAELELETESMQSLPSLEFDPVRELLAGIATPPSQERNSLNRRLERMARGLPAGVDWIELSHDDLDEPVRIFRIVDTESTQQSTVIRTISGRLLEVNFGAGIARLQVPSNRERLRRPSRILLRFPDELAADMQRCLRQMVSVRGEAKVRDTGDLHEMLVQQINVEFDDRRALWPQKRFRWPTIEERLEDVDVEAFLETVHGVDEDDE